MIRFVEISAMKSFFQNYKPQISLLVVATIWLSVVVFIFQVFEQTFSFGDTNSYYLAAIDLYENGRLSDHRPLVFNAINGLPLLFGFAPNAVYSWSLIVNLGCWFATILLLFAIAKRYASEKLAFLIAVFFIGCVGNLFVSFHLMSETVFTFCLTLSLYWIQKYLETTKIFFLIYALALLVLTTMVKPLSLLLGIFVVVFFSRKIVEVVKSQASVVLYLSLSVLFFQMYSLKKEYGNFTVSYIDCYTYYNYLGTRADCLKRNVALTESNDYRYHYFSKFSQSEQKKIAADDFVDQLKHNRVNLLKAYLLNFYGNATKGSASVYGCENKLATGYFEIFHLLFKIIGKAQNILLTGIGILLAFKIVRKWRKTPVFLKICAVFLCYVMAVSAVSCYQGDRFHIVVYPIILIAIAYFYQNRKAI